MGALDGKVAIIIGAGRGIGREHALRFAREGAAVVVNDLGGANDGSGSDAGPAQEVIDEILAAGGRAVANTDNVSSWEGAKGLVEQAVREFGRLDILINNAGILGDQFIASMQESDWDTVIAVHLKGHFSMLRHAAEYWKTQSKAGVAAKAAVVNTSSPSGTYISNAGQANYGPAKAAIAELTHVAARRIEAVRRAGQRDRTRCANATDARDSRHGRHVRPGTGGPVRRVRPENISPIVAYLASDACTITGQVLGVQCGSKSRLTRWQIGETTKTDGPWEIAEIHSRIGTWE